MGLLFKRSVDRPLLKNHRSKAKAAVFLKMSLLLATVLCAACYAPTAATQGLSTKLNEDIQLCVDNVKVSAIRPCLEKVLEACFVEKKGMNNPDEACLLTVGYFVHENYKDERKEKGETSSLIEEISNLTRSRCDEIYRKESHFLTRRKAYASCAYEALILTILADSPYYPR